MLFKIVHTCIDESGSVVLTGNLLLYIVNPIAF